MADVLLGRTSAGSTGDFEVSGNAVAWEFQAVATGEVETIWFRPKVANAGLSSVELGIYTGGGAAPGTKLGSALVGSGFTGTGPYFATLASPVAVTLGTFYWLAAVGVGEQFDWQGDSGGFYSIDAAASPLPATWVEFSTGSNNAIIWGEAAATAPAIDYDYSQFKIPKLVR